MGQYTAYRQIDLKEKTSYYTSMNMTREYFGTAADGTRVDSITIENSSGASIKVITYGARLISCRMPDRDGNLGELITGKQDLKRYEKDLPFHGATIGRYANRIAEGHFEINGEQFELVKNHKLFQLHGGPGGFHQKVWDAYPIRLEDRGTVKFCLTSPDGDQGFPGTLDVSVSVTLTESQEVIFLYEADTDKDTYTSLTNHAFWNLRGEDDPPEIHGHLLQLSSSRYVEVGQDLLPTGTLMPVDDSPFDFRKAKEIGIDLKNIKGFDGYDHNFAVKSEQSSTLIDAAKAEEPESGRVMVVRTTAPGVQFYSDTYSDPPFRGFCLEAGELPDAMHHRHFPQPLHKRGNTYRQVTVHSFSAQ